MKACSLARNAARFSGGKTESTSACPFAATVEAIEPIELSSVFVPLSILSCTPAAGVPFVTLLVCSCTPEDAFFTWSAMFLEGAGEREVSRRISDRFGCRADRICSFRGGLLLLCSLLLPEEAVEGDVVESLHGEAGYKKQDDYSRFESQTFPPISRQDCYHCGARADLRYQVNLLFHRCEWYPVFGGPDVCFRSSALALYLVLICM